MSRKKGSVWALCASFDVGRMRSYDMDLAKRAHLFELGRSYGAGGTPAIGGRRFFWYAVEALDRADAASSFDACVPDSYCKTVGVLSVAEIDALRRAAGKAYVDYAFHLVVSDPTPAVLGQELPALV